MKMKQPVELESDRAMTIGRPESGSVSSHAEIAPSIELIWQKYPTWSGYKHL